MWNEKNILNFPWDESPIRIMKHVQCNSWYFCTKDLSWSAGDVCSKLRDRLVPLLFKYDGEIEEILKDLRSMQTKKPLYSKFSFHKDCRMSLTTTC